jgi:predicted metal-binding protein
MLLLVVVGGYALYLGSAAGVLPWQEEPTRIAITPFADIPGFGGTATATPAP